MGILDKSVILSILLVVTLLVTLSLFSIILGLALYTGKDFDLSADVFRRFMRSQALLTKYESKTFYEAEDFCKSIHKTLPLPKSQHEEDKLVKRINQLGELGECNGFYLGYKQKKDPRYMSLNGSKTWPSINISRDVMIPTMDRDCLEFSFLPLTTVDIRPCSEVNASCYATYGRGDDCSDESPDECHLMRINSLIQGADILEALEAFEYHDTTFIGMIPMDERYYPYVLTDMESDHETCIALAVKNTLEYVAPDGTTMPYTSNRLFVYDVEHDCVGLTTGDSSQLATVTCNTLACVVCD